MGIHLQTLGPPRCYVDGALTDLAAQKLRFGLLVYLALQRTVARESLAALFWPESDEEHARGALSQTIYKLRRRLGDDWIGAEPDPVQVTGVVRVDALEFEQLVAHGDLASALALYRGHFLEGFHVKGSNEFDSWLDIRRSELKRTYQRAARQHIAALSAAGDTDGAVAVAEEWIRRDPLDDEANHVLIEFLASSGKLAAALAQFEVYQQRIREELGAAVPTRTAELVKELREHGTSGSHTSTPQRSGTSSTEASPVAQPLPEPRADQPLNLWMELKQRRVPRMAVWYVGTVFLVLQGVALLVEYFAIPSWTLRATAALAVIGFPLTLVLSWYFEITPDGHLQRDSRAGRFRDQWRVVLTGLVIGLSAVIAAFVAPLVSTSERGITTVLCADGIGTAPCTQSSEVRSDQFVVLPLAHIGDADPQLNGEMCAYLLTQGLMQWEDVNVVDHARVAGQLDALPEAMRSNIPLDTALVMARRLAAGKLIRGVIAQYGDSTRVDAYLHDVVAKQLVRRESGVFPNGSVEAEQVFRELAKKLIAQPTVPGMKTEGGSGTLLYAAWQAFDSALITLSDWDLTNAARHFNTALRRDPDYVHAHLELAYVMLWQGDTSDVWQNHAERAAASANRLGPHDRSRARAIHELASGRFAQACDIYREMLRRNQTFDGWFGLGECLRRDPTVVPNPGSPSGWSFRSSWQEAIDAHRRALMEVPNFYESHLNLYTMQLARLLFLNPGKVRHGVAADNPRKSFYAHPALADDTLALVPYVYSDSAPLAPSVSEAALVQKHREEWSIAVNRWVGKYPDNPRALDAFAWTLEASGKLVPSGTRGNTALGMLRRARGLEREEPRQIRLAAAEARVLLKAGRFKEAQRVAWKALREYPEPPQLEAHVLAGLAGMIGRGHMMASLMAQGADSMDYDRPLLGSPARSDIPPPYIRVLAALLAYASLGEPADSIRVLTQRAHEALNRHAPTEQRAMLHQVGLDRADRMNFPLSGAHDVHLSGPYGMPFIFEQAGLARGDTAAVRRSLDQVDAQFRGQPIDYPADGILTRAQLRLELGDSVRAAQLIDNYLADLSNLARHNFGQPYQPAAIVRLMALRAELAARRSENGTARKWSRAVLDLWDTSDREFQPVLRRMRSLARL